LSEQAQDAGEQVYLPLFGQCGDYLIDALWWDRGSKYPANESSSRIGILSKFDNVGLFTQRVLKLLC